MIYQPSHMGPSQRGPIRALREVAGWVLYQRCSLLISQLPPNPALNDLPIRVEAQLIHLQAFTYPVQVEGIKIRDQFAQHHGQHHLRRDHE